MSKEKLTPRVFEYESKQITFDFGDGHKMINATQMAKVFGKKVNNFLKSQHAKQYIVILESRYSKRSHGSKYKALRVIKGGIPELQGTWMDEKLALKFAAWLNPEFELWVYDRIYELLTIGQTTLPPTKEKITLSRKHLEWVFQKIQDNAMENFHLSDLLKDLKAGESD